MVCCIRYQAAFAPPGQPLGRKGDGCSHREVGCAAVRAAASSTRMVSMPILAALGGLDWHVFFGPPVRQPYFTS